MISWLLGNLWPYLAAGAVALLGVLGSYMAGRRDARLRAKSDALETTVKAMKARERIDDEIQSDPDLVARAERSGVVRPPNQ